jgi:hypothetical protein
MCKKLLGVFFDKLKIFKKEQKKTMKAKILKLMLLALMPAIMLVFASCSNEHKKNAGKNQSIEIGRMEAVAVTMMATVESVDYANRAVTLQGPTGAIGTYRLSSEVVNFDQIKAGDKVKATLIESMAVFVGSSDVQPSVDAIQTVALAPRGEKPGMVAANTAEVVARIGSIDAVNRVVTLIGVAEVPRALAVGPDVNLANVRVGDKVMVRYTEAMAIVVEKP